MKNAGFAIEEEMNKEEMINVPNDRYIAKEKKKMTRVCANINK
ncbi:hypothetical protein ALT721_620044 [Alteromonas alvinellae]